MVAYMEIIESFFSLFSDFVEPKKRVFVGYLLLSVFIALLWLIFIKRLSIQKAFATILDRKIFFSKSTMADYKIFLINRLITFFISPVLITQIAIATTIFYALHTQDVISAGQFSDVNKAIIISLFTASMFLMDDFTKYLVHRWMHKIPLLWAIHKTHHSAETLTPITVYRIHPLEGVLYASRGAFAQGIVISSFIFLFGEAVSLYTVVGVNILVFIFHVTGSNLRHSHISISYWPWLEHIFISPAQHQIHHSIAEEHYDKNFGAALSIWDWLFGSLHISNSDQELAFGLDKSEKSSAVNLRKIYLTPFIEIATVIYKVSKKVLRSLLGLIRSLTNSLWNLNSHLGRKL